MGKRKEPTAPLVAHPSRVTLRCKRLCSSSAREIYPNHSTPHCTLQAHCSLPGQPQPRYLSGECRRGETSPTGPPQWLFNPRHCECTDSAFQIPCRLAVHSDAGCVYVWRGWGAVSKCGLEFCISHHSPNASHFHAIPHGDAGEQHSDSYMARKQRVGCLWTSRPSPESLCTDHTVPANCKALDRSCPILNLGR